MHTRIDGYFAPGNGGCWVYALHAFARSEGFLFRPGTHEAQGRVLRTHMLDSTRALPLSSHRPEQTSSDCTDTGGVPVSAGSGTLRGAPDSNRASESGASILDKRPADEASSPAQERNSRVGEYLSSAAYDPTFPEPRVGAFFQVSFS